MSRGYRILITLVVNIWGLCPKTSFCHISVRHLPYGVNVKTLHAWALQKVQDSLIWWWHLFLLHYLTITLSQSLVLDFCCPSLSILLLTSPLTSSLPSLMFIRIQRLVISSSFLQLSHGSFATFLSLFLILLTSPPWVPSTPILFDGARPSFDRSGHVWSLWVL